MYFTDSNTHFYFWKHLQKKLFFFFLFLKTFFFLILLIFSFWKNFFFNLFEKNLKTFFSCFLFSLIIYQIIHKCFIKLLQKNTAIILWKKRFFSKFKHRFSTHKTDLSSKNVKNVKNAKFHVFESRLSLEKIEKFYSVYQTPCK